VTYDEVIVIPARYGSTRFSGKPLVDIDGVPMVVRVARLCWDALPPEQVIVATDDDRIADVCRQNEIRVEMTSTAHPTGIDRVAEVATRIDSQSYINLMGDEPIFPVEDILTMLSAVRKDRTRVHIGYTEIGEEKWRNSKILKVVFGLRDNLIYIGRARVPGSHDGAFRVGWRHVCIHAYNREHLQRFAATKGRTPVESAEDQEIMRFLELGIDVHVVHMSDDSVSVDRPEDVDIVVKRLREQRKYGG
jgi:3-deoxy-manno-octulosonate cytidylyltransferase (CMP-KDO synthetase)